MSALSPLGSILFLSISASPVILKRLKSLLDTLLKRNGKKKLTNALNKPALESGKKKLIVLKAILFAHPHLTSRTKVVTGT